jgi:hypothetical protein
VSDCPIWGVGASAYMRRPVSGRVAPPISVPTGVRSRKRTVSGVRWERGATRTRTPRGAPPFSLSSPPSLFLSSLLPPPPPPPPPRCAGEKFWGVGAEGESVRVTPLPSADGVGCPRTPCVIRRGVRLRQRAGGIWVSGVRDLQGARQETGGVTRPDSWEIDHGRLTVCARVVGWRRDAHPRRHDVGCRWCRCMGWFPSRTTWRGHGL